MSDTTLVAGVLTRLDALTAKLGVGATEVWGIWLASAWRPMLDLAMWLGVATVLAVGWWVGVGRVTTEPYQMDERRMMRLFGVSMIAFITGLVVTLSLPDVIAYQIDPRLYALEQLKGLLGGAQ